MLLNLVWKGLAIYFEVESHMSQTGHKFCAAEDDPKSLVLQLLLYSPKFTGLACRLILGPQACW